MGSTKKILVKKSTNWLNRERGVRVLSDGDERRKCSDAANKKIYKKKMEKKNKSTKDINEHRH